VRPGSASSEERRRREEEEERIRWAMKMRCVQMLAAEGARMFFEQQQLSHPL
jgi:hypothetical protein